VSGRVVVGVVLVLGAFWLALTRSFSGWSDAGDPIAMSRATERPGRSGRCGTFWGRVPRRESGCRSLTFPHDRCGRNLEQRPMLARGHLELKRTR
jgi:hypothetical protein